MLMIPIRGPSRETNPSEPTGPPATEKKNKDAKRGAVSVFWEETKIGDSTTLLLVESVVAVVVGSSDGLVEDDSGFLRSGALSSSIPWSRLC